MPVKSRMSAQHAAVEFEIMKVGEVKEPNPLTFTIIWRVSRSR
jgi:hypothetical protein